MEDQNHRTNHAIAAKIISYTLCIITMIAVGQQTMAKAKAEQNISEVMLEGKEAFSPWYEEDFYEKHREYPDYELGSPDQAEKVFIKNKYAILRNKMIEELIVALRNIVLMVVATILIEYYRDPIADKIRDIIPYHEVIFNSTILRNKDRGFFLLLMKYLYKHWGSRGFITPYESIDNWGADELVIVLKHFLKNFLTLCVLAIPLYSKVKKNTILSTALLLGLVNPPVCIFCIVLITGYTMWSSHIMPMVMFWMYGETAETLDDMQDIEVTFVRNEHRFIGKDKEREALITKLLLEARKYPKKRSKLKEIIENIIGLPTKEEASAKNKIKGRIDLSAMYAYEKHVIAYAERLCYRSVEGINKMHHPYLLGISGVGKTKFIQLIAKTLDANIATVSLAGASAKELIGYPAENGKEGYIGRIPKALKEANKDGKPIILFFDEIDKALDKANPYASEISALFLELFESKTFYFTCPFLDDLPVYFPNIIIFAGNKDFTGPLRDRLDVIEFHGYNYHQKRLIIYGTKQYKGKLDQLCREVGLKRKDLTKEDYQDIERIINTMEEEERKLPKRERDLGLRQLEIRIIQALFLKTLKKDYMRLKAQMEKNVKSLPKVEAF